MQSVNSVSPVRMVLAMSAVIVVGGAGMALAVGPGPNYPPKYSVLLGPTSVAHGAAANYVLHVTFADDLTADFPPTTGTVFSAAIGSITSAGYYTAPATGSRDSVTGKFNALGVTTQAGRVIALTD